MPKIARRDFIRGLGVGGIGLLAAACAPAAPAAQPAPTLAPTPAAASPTAPSAAAPAVPTPAPAAPKPTAQAPAAAKPQPKVARLVVGSIPPVTEGVNPNRDYNANDSAQLRPMYEYLIGTDTKTGNWIPELAESWTVEPDGKSLRFKLRKGVQFHNGFGEFTARDVVFTRQDMITPEGSKANTTPQFRDLVEAIEVVNDYEVVFRNRSAEYSLLFSISRNAGNFEMKSKADFDARSGKPSTPNDPPLAGTGPYQFKERVPAQYIRFERVPYQHWRITPDFPELELRWVPENSTRAAAVLTGEIHLTLLPTDLSRDVVSRGARILPAAIAGNQIGFNIMGAYLKDPQNSDEWLYPNSPVTDLRVRRALNKAVDRAALNKAFYAGQGEPHYLQYYNASISGWDPQFQQRFPDMYGYDPAAAKSLLADAGYGPGGKPIRVGVISRPDPAAPEAQDLMEAVATMFRAIGVDAPLETSDAGQFRTRRDALGFDSQVDFNSSSSHPVGGLRVTNTTLFARRGQAVESRAIDQQFLRAIAEFDDAKREPLWRELGRMSYEFFQPMPILRTRYELVSDPRVVASQEFPGFQVTTVLTHLENTKAA